MSEKSRRMKIRFWWFVEKVLTLISLPFIIPLGIIMKMIDYTVDRRNSLAKNEA